MTGWHAARQELAAAVVGEGLRPLAAASTPAPLQQLLEACWQRDPAARPTAAQLVATLEAQLLAYTDAEAVPLGGGPPPTVLPVGAGAGAVVAAPEHEAGAGGAWVLPARAADGEEPAYCPQVST